MPTAPVKHERRLLTDDAMNRKVDRLAGLLDELNLLRINEEANEEHRRTGR